MVSRIYVEKKPGFDVEAQQLLAELRTVVGDGLPPAATLRVINVYDVEGISDELFEACVPTVFSEPQVDNASRELPVAGAVVGAPGSGQGIVAQGAGATLFAVESLPGQFDQRADSAAECIQLISQGERPTVRCAKLYAFDCDLAPEALAAIKRYVINPVEARETALALRDTLAADVPTPEPVEVLTGFNELDDEGLAAFVAERGLAMDLADIRFCQEYFRSEDRDPTITEIKVVDTYWSDHCRHTTFGTQLDSFQIDDPQVAKAYDRYLQMRHELGRDAKPVCLMDMGTLGARWLKAKGVLTGVDESEEVNACTVKVKVDVDGEEQDWLYLFKNETHNHPTEIEPFGGAATCLGGAIRDPLSGRSYVYQAMRVTGSGRPHRARLRDDARQAAAAQARDDRRGRLRELRQPDRPGDRPGERAVPPRLRRQAHGDRRRGGRHPGRPREARDARPRRRRGAARRPHGPRRHRRRHGQLQGAQRGIHREGRRGGAEGQPARWSARSSACSAAATHAASSSAATTSAPAV